MFRIYLSLYSSHKEKEENLLQESGLIIHNFVGRCKYVMHKMEKMKPQHLPIPSRGRLNMFEVYVRLVRLTITNSCSSCSHYHNQYPAFSFPSFFFPSQNIFLKILISRTKRKWKFKKVIFIIQSIWILMRDNTPLLSSLISQSKEGEEA